MVLLLALGRASRVDYPDHRKGQSIDIDVWFRA